MKKLLAFVSLYVTAMVVPPNPSPRQPIEMMRVCISEDHSVIIDEAILLQWEDAIRCTEEGEPTDVKLPGWLLSGFEQITHVTHEEPRRTDLLMPLYWYLEFEGHLEDVNVNRMTPHQVVKKMRLFVDEMKKRIPPQSTKK